MPGFTTHYLFGSKTWLSLPDTQLKETFATRSYCFHLGLQGPDVFFYYLPSYVIHRHNIGSVAHTKQTQQFFRNLLYFTRKLFTKNELAIAQAYTGGCFAHYVLDTTCHPYVYHKTHYDCRRNDYFGQHVKLETEIDTLLLKRERRLPLRAFHQEATINLSVKEIDVISLLLFKTYKKTYPYLSITQRMVKRAIRSFQWGCKFLRDPSGKKKTFIEKWEQLFLGYPVLSTLIAQDRMDFNNDPLNLNHELWTNPWDTSLESCESFEDLMKSGREHLLVIWELTEKLWKDPSHLDKPTLLKLLKTLGNKSYHSGLSCRIPS